MDLMNVTYKFTENIYCRNSEIILVQRVDKLYQGFHVLPAENVWFMKYIICGSCSWNMKYVVLESSKCGLGML